MFVGCLLFWRLIPLFAATCLPKLHLRGVMPHKTSYSNFTPARNLKFFRAAKCEIGNNFVFLVMLVVLFRLRTIRVPRLLELLKIFFTQFPHFGDLEDLEEMGDLISPISSISPISPISPFGDFRDLGFSFNSKSIHYERKHAEKQRLFFFPFFLFRPFFLIFSLFFFFSSATNFLTYLYYVQSTRYSELPMPKKTQTKK